MRKFFFALAFALPAFIAAAQETNALKTDLEKFEAQTNTLIVKAVGPVGSMAIGSAQISVRCKESNDLNHDRKIYGIAVEIAGEGLARQLAILDEEELEPLKNACDYLTRLTSDITSLPAFEAQFVTRTGLCLTAHCRRRQGNIQYQLQFGDGARVALNTENLMQLKNLVSQAQNSIGALKQAK